MTGNEESTEKVTQSNWELFKEMFKESPPKALVLFPVAYLLAWGLELGPPRPQWQCRHCRLWYDGGEPQRPICRHCRSPGGGQP